MLPNPFLKILCADMCGMCSDSIYLSPAPLYHAAPLRFNMMAITLGGTSIIMESFDAEQFLRLVEKHKVTQSQLVPTMFVRMLKLPEEVRQRYDVSSLQGAIHAAAPCPVEVKAQMIEWWGPILIEYYAGSEGNGVTVSTSQQWLDAPRHRRPRGGRQGQDPRRERSGVAGGADRHGLFRRRAGVFLSQRPGQDPSAPTTPRAGRRSATSAISTTRAISISPTARPT